MANVMDKDTNLKDLRQRAVELASAVESLAALFEREEVRFRQRDEVACLKTLCSAVIQRMEQVRGEEMAASYGHSKARAVSSLVQLGAGLITMKSENRTVRAISRQLLTGSISREPPYGTVLVRVGPKGLPEDVEVVSISSLARESKQDESDVKDRLLAGGNLLFAEETFSKLIDRLADEILRGSLGLPVSVETLSRFQQRRVLRLNPKKKG